MPPRISAHLITWGDEFVTALDEVSSLGYTACETFTHIAMRYEDSIDEFRELLDSRGLRLSALYGGGRFSDPSRRDEVIAYNERVARFLAANGADRIVFGPGGPRTEGGTTTEALKEAAVTMTKAAQRCLDLGVRACVHPHLGTELQDRRELDIIMELTDPEVLGLTVDTAHVTAAGMDAIEVITTYRDRLGYLHFKDLTPTDADDPEVFPILRGDEALPIFCELGLGTVDLLGVLGTLDDIGYDGWLTVEIDQSTSTPIESLRVCRDFLQQRAGIPVGVTA